MKRFLELCVWVRCMDVSTCLSIRGHTVTIHCELFFFFDTVWQTLFCQTGCCKACFIFFHTSSFLISSDHLRIITDPAPFTGLWPDFIPTQKKQKPGIGVDWFLDSIVLAQYWLYGKWSVHKYCLEIVQLKSMYFMDQNNHFKQQ